MDKKKISANILAGTIVATVAFFMQAGSVDADAWWGEGYKKPSWVLEHGGSLIKYKIVGKEDSDEYKARLYLGNRMVELEYGGSGYFDDAINNNYTVIVFKGTKKQASTTVTARPGETISLKFDLKKDKVEKKSEFIPIAQISLNSDSAKYVSRADLGVKLAAKPAAKSAVVESPPTVPETAPEAEAAIIVPASAEKDDAANIGGMCYVQEASYRMDLSGAFSAVSI